MLLLGLNYKKSLSIKQKHMPDNYLNIIFVPLKINKPLVLFKKTIIAKNMF